MAIIFDFLGGRVRFEFGTFHRGFLEWEDLSRLKKIFSCGEFLIFKGGRIFVFGTILSIAAIDEIHTSDIIGDNYRYYRP